MGISNAKAIPTCQILCCKIHKLTTLVNPAPCQGGEQREILVMSAGTTSTTRQLPPPRAVSPTGGPRGQ